MDRRYIGLGDIVFVGKIDGGLDPRGNAKAFILPRRNRLRHTAAGKTHRLTALRLGFSGEQIGESFGLEQIESTVFKCASREFARPGWAQTIEASEPREHCRDDRAAAVQVQFDDIFTRRRSGTRETQRKRTIDKSAYTVFNRNKMR